MDTRFETFLQDVIDGMPIVVVAGLTLVGGVAVACFLAFAIFGGEELDPDDGIGVSSDELTDRHRKGNTNRRSGDTGYFDSGGDYDSGIDSGGLDGGFDW